jgi:hypothetical protein
MVFIQRDDVIDGGESELYCEEVARQKRFSVLFAAQ